MTTGLFEPTDRFDGKDYTEIKIIFYTHFSYVNSVLGCYMVLVFRLDMHFHLIFYLFNYKIMCS